MNNREKLQQQFKQAINDGYRYSETGLEEAASNCTTVCMEAMEGFLEWADINAIRSGDHSWKWKGDGFDKRYSTTELLTEYNNLNNK